MVANTGMFTIYKQAPNMRLKPVAIQILILKSVFMMLPLVLHLHIMMIIAGYSLGQLSHLMEMLLGF
jgi:hypothetical protein